MNNLTVSGYLKKYSKEIIVVALCALIGGGWMGYSAKKHKITEYTANRDVVISHNIEPVQSNSTNDNNSVVVNDLNMMPTYKDIVENDLIANQARKRLPKKLQKKYSVNALQSVLGAKTSQQSLVMRIKADTRSQKDSVAIVNAASEAFQNELPKLQLGAGKVTLLQKANVNNTSSTTRPSVKKHTVVGLALGALLGLIISLVSVTIKNFVK